MTHMKGVNSEEQLREERHSVQGSARAAGTDHPTFLVPSHAEPGSLARTLPYTSSLAWGFQNISLPVTRFSCQVERGYKYWGGQIDVWHEDREDKRGVFKGKQGWQAKIIKTIRESFTKRGVRVTPNQTYRYFINVKFSLLKCLFYLY